MRSPYLYILIKWNTIKKHGGVLDAEYLWENQTLKGKWNITNQTIKGNQEKKKQFSAAAEKWAKCCRGSGGIHPGSC